MHCTLVCPCCISALGGPVLSWARVTEFNFTEKLARTPGGGGSNACGLTWWSGWIIFGGPVRGSTGMLWMTSFRVSCRVSLVHCRTWCPKGSLQREQLLSGLEVTGMAVSSFLLSWSWAALFFLSLLAASSNLLLCPGLCHARIHHNLAWQSLWFSPSPQGVL